ADDLLATLAIKASRDGYDVYLVTADKDMLQVLCPGVYIYDPSKNATLGAEDVKRRFGLPPERIPELMALTGDSIDNIPGVKGIGEKTATKLLSKHSLEELINKPELAGGKRVSELIKDSIDDIRLSYELSLIRADAPVEFSSEDVLPRAPDYQRLFEIFRELEFSKLMELIPSERQEVSFRVVFDEGELISWLKEIGDHITLYPVADRGSNLIGLSICSEKEPLYIPCMHRYLGAPKQLNCEGLINALSPVLQSDRTVKVGHDLKRLMKAVNQPLKGELQDVMVLSYLLNPNRSDHSLKEIVLEYLNKKTDTEKELLSSDVSSQEVEWAGSLASEAVLMIERLRKELIKRLKAEGLDRLYHDIEMPLIEVLYEMEKTGVKIDTRVLGNISRELEAELIEIKRRIYELAGEEFNINSPKQLSRVLFEKLGLKPIRKTKTGYSTDVRVLEELAKEHELPGDILNWRSLTKLKNTYVDSLPKLINPETGRIHTTFNQTVTATGRLSSSEPNLQNIPIRGQWGRKIREAFVAEEGAKILSADYSQIELRVLAHLSGDERLCRAFLEDRDIHTATAMELFEVGPEDVTQDMRRIAKTVNFGVVYGISAYGLSEAIEVSMEDAQSYIDEYFLKYEGVRQYYDRVIEEAKRLGYVKTLFGRKRPVPELLSPNMQQSSLGQRLAMNSPVQGTAADIIKLAMVRIYRRLKKGSYRTRMILQVHDELLFEVYDEELEEIKELVRKEMEGVVELRVPLKVDIGVANNWADAH
ncbi:MAG: DNA polymerase I, partial [Nitrospirae bacterium]